MLDACTTYQWRRPCPCPLPPAPSQSRRAKQVRQLHAATVHCLPLSNAIPCLKAPWPRERKQRVSNLMRRVLAELSIRRASNTEPCEGLAATVGNTSKKPQGKVGQRWWSFSIREYRRHQETIKKRVIQLSGVTSQ